MEANTFLVDVPPGKPGATTSVFGVPLAWYLDSKPSTTKEEGRRELGGGSVWNILVHTHKDSSSNPHHPHKTCHVGNPSAEDSGKDMLSPEANPELTARLHSQIGVLQAQ